ncbi:MAG: SH3 domain-containing protein, partial [Gammaproteobacteria bacterium]|nr:SH3 domain-containing protein [Gammaproteobacteria bacterium]
MFTPFTSIIAADVSKLYFGANVGYTEGDYSDNTSASSVKKLTMGYTFNQYLTLDISRFSQDHSWSSSIFESGFEDRIVEKISVSGFSVSSLFNYPFSSRFSMFARAGATSWNINQDSTFSFISISDGSNLAGGTDSDQYTGVGFIIGSGARYMFGPKRNFELRVEWEKASYEFSGFGIASHNFSVEENLSLSTNSISAGLMYYFGKAQSAKVGYPIILPSATLSDANTDEDKALLFALDLTHSISTDIPFELSLISSEDKDELNVQAKAIEVSFDKGQNWQGVAVSEISSINDDGNLESLIMDGNFNFIFPANNTTSLIRIKTENENIANTTRSIQLNLKSKSDLIANTTLRAKGIIFKPDIEKSDIASFEEHSTNASLSLAPVVATIVLPAKIMAPEIIKPLPVAALAKIEDEPAEEVPVIELKAIASQQPPKKRVLPLVRPFEEKKATPNELAVSNLIWNDVKAYNAFDDVSPILLPGIDLIGDWVDASTTKQLSSDSMYEEAENAARKGNAGVAIWGNSLEYGGNIYIASHLSLVDEPVAFGVELNSLKTLNLSLSIPRTRFSFALKELSNKDINQHKLVTLQGTSIYQQRKSSSKVLATINTGVIIDSANTKNEWFRVNNVNNQSGWVHASMVAVLPDEVYTKTATIKVFGEVDSGETRVIKSPIGAIDVLNVEMKNGVTWFQVKLPSSTGWVDSKNLKSKPILPMTEFMLGMQYFQKQDFENAIQAIKRFIETADKENENNVALSTAYQMLALCYMQQANWAEAGESIDSAITLTRYDPSIYSFKAITLLGDQLINKQKVSLIDVMKNLEYALYLEPDDALAKDVVSALNK